MRHRALAVVLALLSMLTAGCQADPRGETTISVATTAEATTSTFPTLPVEDAPSKFEKGELVAAFGFSLDDHATLSGLPTDRDDAPPSGGSGSFDRQSTELVASGFAKSWAGDPPWEHFEFGELDEFGNSQFGGYLPADKVGFLGATEDVSDQVADLVNERVDDLALDVARSFAGAGGLEVVSIMQREFGGRELAYDLVGGIDAATAGWRLQIVMEEDGDLFRVVQVSRTVFCWFAVDESGECVEDPGP